MHLAEEIRLNSSLILLLSAFKVYRTIIANVGCSPSLPRRRFKATEG